ncbi:DUF3592 domain-containing protein [Streptacidiphilus jiangxiensis]|uniref:DUF3592 domain-containing protein n=1 Tax=Streptacidiphilus jiangxiensis TaxID=235985 RepID=UPI00116094A2|nr:DUF3592 domain-containing protein [Streptacidiphilus jiangxiensis]
MRRTLRRVGVSGMARVVAAEEIERVQSSVAVGPGGTTEDGAPAGEVPEGPELDHADNAPMLSFEVEGHGEVVTRPRGWTSIRRSSALAVGTLVPIAYDPQQPTRVALDGVPQSRSDLFWLLLGLAFAACGVTLLATAF